MKDGLRSLVDSLGLTGVLGLGLLCFAGAFYVNAIRPSAGRLGDLQREQAKLERAQDRERGQSASAVTPEVQLQDFYEQLAPEKSVDRLLEKIVLIARKHGIVLKQGSYRFSWQGDRFGRYEVAFSAQTSYYQTRMFIHEVLYEMPMVSLDDVGFQRSQTTTGGVEMNANFSMLVRRER